MARRALVLLVLSLSAVGLSAGAAPAGTAGWRFVSTPRQTVAAHRPDSAASGLERGVLANVNSLRREHGLSSLRFSSKLTAAARSHSEEMAQRGYFSHDSANGGSFDRRIARFYSLRGSRYWSVGENLLWSSPDVDPAGALNMWLNSPEHKKILLSSRWREIGIAAVHTSSAPGSYGGREVTIVTADFGVRR
jgi:uncharacterized protein YkwD